MSYITALTENQSPLFGEIGNQDSITAPVSSSELTELSANWGQLQQVSWIMASNRTITEEDTFGKYQNHSACPAQGCSFRSTSD